MKPSHDQEQLISLKFSEDFPKYQRQLGLCHTCSYLCCPILGLSPLKLKQSVSGVRQDPDLPVLCMHHASAQQVTQNTVKANVLQNRSTFQLGNTGSYQVIAYMGIVSALKILSDPQRHIPHLCEHGYGHNFIMNSDAIAYSPSTARPVRRFIFTHTLSTLFNLILKAPSSTSL